MSYFDFVSKINKNHIKTIFELGSRDLIDAIKLHDFYNCKIYAFECNPDCLIECNKNLLKLNEDTKKDIILVNKAVSLTNSNVSFYPFDLNKYNNMGSSSMYKIDFSKRDIGDPDYNRSNPQKEIIVEGTRLDTFIDENNIDNIDLLCIDLQGYELNALKSFGEYLNKVKYIISECSIRTTYTGGCSFIELENYLSSYGFKYICSNKFQNNYPDLNLTGFNEFDALFFKVF